MSLEEILRIDRAPVISGMIVVGVTTVIGLSVMPNIANAATSIKFTEDFSISFAISRWWDILIAPIWSIIFWVIFPFLAVKTMSQEERVITRSEWLTNKATHGLALHLREDYLSGGSLGLMSGLGIAIVFGPTVNECFTGFSILLTLALQSLLLILFRLSYSPEFVSRKYLGFIIAASFILGLFWGLAIGLLCLIIGLLFVSMYYLLMKLKKRIQEKRA